MLPQIETKKKNEKKREKKETKEVKMIKLKHFSNENVINEMAWNEWLTHLEFEFSEVLRLQFPTASMYLILL